MIRWRMCLISYPVPQDTFAEGLLIAKNEISQQKSVTPSLHGEVLALSHVGHWLTQNEPNFTEIGGLQFLGYLRGQRDPSQSVFDIVEAYLFGLDVDHIRTTIRSTDSNSAPSPTEPPTSVHFLK